MSDGPLQVGARVGRFTVAHALPRRVRLRSPFLGAPEFDAAYFQALLEALPGVESVTINVRGRSIAIVFDGTPECWHRISGYLEDVPREARLRHADEEEPIRGSDVLLRVLLTGAAQTMPLPAKAGLSWALCLETVVKGVSTLLTRGLKVEVLDGMAVGLSLARGNYFTAGAITTLLALGEYLEEHSEQRSAKLLKSLLRPQAERLWVVRDGIEVSVPAAEVVVGDQVVCGPGEAIAVDGRVVEGEASVNQSSITGESVPVHLAVGDPVISGSVIDEGRLVVEVEHAGSETSVARIGRFIDQSLRNKSKRQTKSSELADKLAPISLGLAGVAFLATRDINRMTSVLTVDYSCAVKLATPIAVRSGIYAAGHSGVLLKGAAAMDALQDADTLVFDKTGTLTTGKLTVTDVLALNGYSGDEVLSLAAGAEEHYDHPVARAVVKEAATRRLPLPPISRVDFIVAHGVSAFIDGKNILVGSHHFIAEDEAVPCEHMDESAHSLRADGKSLLYVAKDGELIGIIALRDQPRPEAREVLTALKNSGIRNIVVLTGDHKDTALALHTQLPEIDEIHYELKPEDKASVVESLKASGANVAFIGDGVNDAPALVNADVGICMPKGADIAKESAQVLLMKEDLYTIVYAREAAARTNNVIRRCFQATIGFNSATIAMAVLGLQPAVAALLHNLSTIGILGYAGMASSRSITPVKALPQE